jgi:predicted kinase
MPKLVILRGVSGSGKSTWAEAQPNAIIVSRDRIRAGIFGSADQDYYVGDVRSKEALVTKVQDATIAEALRAGSDVIVDNTNVEWKYVKALVKIGQRHGADISVKVFDAACRP